MILNKNKTIVMGVINITPDSFSDGGKFNSVEAAVAHAEQLIKEGADILDIGGESTRPFAEPVSVEEEKKRVLPVIKEISKSYDIPISIDTYKAEVAKEALLNGASIINDISAMTMDKNMVNVALKFNCPIIIMHMKGTPGTMQKNPFYEDLMGEIESYFAERINFALSKGISRDKLILDPGIGFGKTLSHNLIILKKLSSLKKFGLPILIGSSRKTFIRKITGKDDLPTHEDVITGSVASACAAVLNGADIVRVHDVAKTCAALKIIDSMKNI